jgi:eukaryotic-like serine/threonine-protein kinase
VLSYIGRLRSSEPRPLLRPDVPPELAEVIFRCLQKDRAQRYPDAATVRAALSAITTEVQGWVPQLPRDIGTSEATVRLPDEVAGFGPRPEYGTFEPPSGKPAEALTMPAPYRPEEVTARRPKRKRGVLFALLALLLGGLIGVAVVVLNGPPRGTTAAPPASTTPPQSTVATTRPAATVPPGGDPAFAPTITGLEDKGTSIKVSWTDPTAGKAQFVVIDATGTPSQPLGTVAAGSTTYTVERLDRTARQYCFQVLAIGLDDPANQRGASDRSCAVRKG